MRKPRVEKQGTVIIECHYGSEYMILFPDGEIVSRYSRWAAEAVARRWLREHAQGDAVNVGLIEWRQIAPGGALEGQFSQGKARKTLR